ncbi:peptigoglycan-binding protein LysM [Streptomyces adustus]|uniref:Peptigoglycan-binding protein LysM n=1 Tax=Streptomyces adustus TaxID=1609272 RepID=A0A5N8VG21_9ACTN|nr:transglycosylase family protein [Streptomyces adustus]MPY33776.1 peptigoglycan-binding protein LysM [Streptomyces adustus]
MLSGNGRHRRPRQAPALLVAAGVAGSAIAIPLLGAGGASAAEGSTWDQVAQCETGGSWSADSGDGHFGGLHLTQADWEQYGGLDYASRADLASRSQQIAVAEKILAAQGAGAWSTCGLTSGLAADSATAVVDTGVAGDTASGTTGTTGSASVSDPLGLPDSTAGTTADPSATPAAGTASADPSALPSGTASPDAPSATTTDKSDKSADVATSDAQTDDSSASGAKSNYSDNARQSIGASGLVDTGDLGTGRHRGTSADEDESSVDADLSFIGRHASTAYAADGS